MLVGQHQVCSAAVAPHACLLPQYLPSATWFPVCIPSTHGVVFWIFAATCLTCWVLDVLPPTVAALCSPGHHLPHPHQAQEVEALKKDLETARSMVQSLEANTKAADGRVADAATTLTVAKQQVRASLVRCST